MTRYVQSKWSKDAPVWEVYSDLPSGWMVLGAGIYYTFAKSEYIEVPAPEKWEDVTAECSIYGGKLYHRGVTRVLHPDNWGSFKVEKVEVNFIGKGIENGCAEGVAFIVKRKVKP